jgi:hypothetical protein
VTFPVLGLSLNAILKHSRSTLHASTISTLYAVLRQQDADKICWDAEAR